MATWQETPINLVTQNSNSRTDGCSPPQGEMKVSSGNGCEQFITSEQPPPTNFEEEGKRLEAQSERRKQRDNRLKELTELRNALLIDKLMDDARDKIVRQNGKSSWDDLRANRSDAEFQAYLVEVTKLPEGAIALLL
ncbi:hypothetical protein BDZ89DRAFT_1063857 [Hymenopellis radicata]|nr:hypothetical protein BDZ89DRAFT_1063857 [Hymenopellis radicata]